MATAIRPAAPIKLASPLSKIGAIFRRDARVALSYPANFALNWVAILVEVVVYWYISRIAPHDMNFSPGGRAMSYFEYVAINGGILRFQTAALYSFAEAIRDAQLTGTLEMVMATPTRMPTLVLSSGLWSFTLTAIQTIVYFGIAMLFGLDLSHVNPLTALAFLLLTIAAVSPLGVLAAALAMVIKKTGPIDLLSNSSAQIFGGFFLPLARLPLALQIIGWLIPITHAMNGFRAAVSGLSLYEARADAIWLLCASIVLMPFSLWLFTRAVQKARVDGTLAMY
jgi:ABC-2 type transport system permease protein